jgi:hypothetical protein
LGEANWLRIGYLDEAFQIRPGRKTVLTSQASLGIVKAKSELRDCLIIFAGRSRQGAAKTSYGREITASVKNEQVLCLSNGRGWGVAGAAS